MSDAQRFDRQVRFAPLGVEGQRRLGEARVLLVGCGALGGMLAQSLVRSGVGRLVLVDRDVVDATNLPRQVLFDERHARDATPKAEAARETLARIGGPTAIEAHVAHVDADDVERFAEGSALVLDGTDNLATRYLLNDWSVVTGTPWIYGAVVGSEGRVLAVRPRSGPCLRCVFPDPPAAGALATCDTAGVIQPAVALVAAVQSGLALRLLAGDAVEPFLYDLDVWDPRLRRIAVERDPACPCCAAGELAFLRPKQRTRALVFCGRNAVQVRGPGRADLVRIALAVGGLARGLRRTDGLLRFEIEGAGLDRAVRFTVFDDGRALVEGTEDEERALALYDRYIGA